MKQLIALLTAVLMLLSLAACSAEEKKVTKKSNHSSSAAQDEQGEQEIFLEGQPDNDTELPEQQEPDGSSDPDAPVSSPAVATVLNLKCQPAEWGTYICILELFSNGTFTMNVNVLEGFVYINGTYTVENGIYYGTIPAEERPIGFLGQDATGFILEPQDAHSYVITILGDDGIGALQNGFAFYQNNT